MSKEAKPHFSKSMLRRSERFQQAFGHTSLGKFAVSMISGSWHPRYRQLDWYSGDDIKEDVRTFVRAPGDPNAGRLPRNWNTAIIMAAEISEIKELKSQTEEGALEAVAYQSEGVLHVGANDKYSRLFEYFNESKRAIAMRIGRGPLVATMGLWIPEEREFKGLNNVWLVPSNGPYFIGQLDAQLPQLPLV